MDILEKIFIILFLLVMLYVIYMNWKCGKGYHTIPKPPVSEVKTPPAPISKFEVGDYIEDSVNRSILKVTGFYITESGKHMTTAISVENSGYKVEQRNQSSTAYSTVALNHYYKKIDYAKVQA